MSYRCFSWLVRPQVWTKSNHSRLLSLLIFLQLDFTERQTDQMCWLHSLQTCEPFLCATLQGADMPEGEGEEGGKREASYLRARWERIQI